jgi:hypothetical protein
VIGPFLGNVPDFLIAAVAVKKLLELIYVLQQDSQILLSDSRLLVAKVTGAVEVEPSVLSWARIGASELGKLPCVKPSMRARRYSSAA